MNDDSDLEIFIPMMDPELAELKEKIHFELERHQRCVTRLVNKWRSLHIIVLNQLEELQHATSAVKIDKRNKLRNLTDQCIAIMDLFINQKAKVKPKKAEQNVEESLVSILF